MNTLPLLSGGDSPLADPKGKPEDEEPTDAQRGQHPGAQWRFGGTEILSISSNRMHRVYIYTMEYCPAGKLVN